MNLKRFYDEHKNFTYRTLSEYFISPGIKCKFDIIKNYLGTKIQFKNGIDLGCSGDSILYFLENVLNKSFLDIAYFPLKQYTGVSRYNPLCGGLTQLPYRDQSFDFVSALDVLEHIRDDDSAVSEISRILKHQGIAVITVPHRMKYYTKQDRLIGHYKRYEIDQIISLFKKYNLYQVRTFGVYGQFMRIADVQSFNPEKTEKNLLNLRKRYVLDAAFRKIWDFVVKISSKFMKLDAQYNSLKRIMNLGFIFRKD
jgi:SAM-dependent methyltransferase